jgi:hypothetical protein
LLHDFYEILLEQDQWPPARMSRNFSPKTSFPKTCLNFSFLDQKFPSIFLSFIFLGSFLEKKHFPSLYSGATYKNQNLRTGFFLKSLITESLESKKNTEVFLGSEMMISGVIELLKFTEKSRRMEVRQIIMEKACHRE